ncbi:MAG: helix-turn-helix domain-containing protein [bacterium]|nr:helix-turn-helix domain-containing protein [bacterium]
MTQDEALEILKTGASVFLTGEPGSGKTYAVNRFVAWLRDHGVAPAVTASTGIAATHIGGYTIHSWSGIGVKQVLTKQDLRRIAGNRRTAGRIRNAYTLIIDEISMLSARTFAMVEEACRFVRGGTTPFGGLQVVVVGDFFQLPPVQTNDGRGGDGSAPLFCFDSPAWHELNPIVCYLSEQHRQEDAVFLELLAAIRTSAVTPVHETLLASRAPREPAHASGITKLFSHNRDVDRVNDTELAKLPSAAQTFEMTGSGPAHLVEQLKRGCLSPELLSLKLGARVMFTKNDTLEHRFVNGTLGIITGFSPDDSAPIVQTTIGKRIIAERAEWRIEEGTRVLARIVQIPLRLAWAITVHKSQGMSLDEAHMDLSNAFEFGQGYVALSRLRTLAGLSLTGWNARALAVHPDMCAKDAAFREASKRTRDDFFSRPATEREGRQAEFIHACGGSVRPNVRTERPANDGFSGKKIVKKERCSEETLRVIRKGKNVEAAARARGMKPNTIIAHLEELLILNMVNRSDIAHLASGKEKIITEIHTAFRELGADRLKPAYDRLGGRVSYDIIRLARLLFDPDKRPLP